MRHCKPNQKVSHVFQILFLALAVFLTTAGCSSRLVKVKGTLNASGTAGVVPPKGARIFVMDAHTDTEEDIQKRVHVEKTVRRVLDDLGYTAANIADADYYLAVSYGVGAVRESKESIPMVTTYAPFAVTVTTHTEVTSPTAQPVSPAPVMVQHTRKVYDIWLSCVLVDGQDYRKNREMKAFWTGRAVISDNHVSGLGNSLRVMLPRVLETMGKTAEFESLVSAKEFYLSPR